MPDTYTQNFGWTLPEVGASRDTWGQKWNVNLTSIDQYMGFAAPIGMMVDFAGPQAPLGWLIADGRLISRVTYSALFAVVGTSWGVGDGSTTFALPNPIGRASVGPGTMIDGNGQSYGFSFTQTVGNVANQIAQAHLPNYAITTDVQGNHSHGGATAPGGNHNHTTDGQGNHSHTGATYGNYAGITLNDPTHTHNFNDYTIGASSSNYINAGGANVGSTYISNVTAAAATGITLTDPGHVHGIPTDGYHTHNVSYSGNLQLGIYADGSHQHTIYLGGSSAWFPVLSPVICITKIIYAGNQAVARVTAQAAPTAPRVTEDEPDELAIIREELAALRALFAPAARHPRLQQAPIRGPH
jgi:microcystin-dependent protein